MSKYPEADKVTACRNDSQIIGNFLEWLQDEKGCRIHEPSISPEESAIQGALGTLICSQCNQPRDTNFHVIVDTVEQLLYKYFDIDEDKYEEERQQMIDEIRIVNGE